MRTGLRDGMRTAVGVVAVIGIVLAGIFFAIGIGTVFGISPGWVIIGIVGAVVAGAIFMDNFC